MTPKQVDSAGEAVAEVFDGAVVMIGGFGRAGVPEGLTDALSARRARGLTVISNNAGTGRTGIARLLSEGCVAKIICSYPRPAESGVFKELYDAGKLELELVPQGTLAERIRAGGAGLGGFLTLTGVGTELAEGKQVMEVAGREYVLEMPLRADVALVKAHKVDPWGNLTYRKAARTFNPIMAMAAKRTIVQASEAVPLGSLDPECVITPGIYVDRYCIYNGSPPH
jgi:3-oxoadipate CoA-transferase alpha subunit